MFRFKKVLTEAAVWNAAELICVELKGTSSTEGI